MTDEEIKKRLKLVYDCIPKLECKRKCEECCGPIHMSYVEWVLVQRTLGYKPEGKSLECPMLKDGRCSVYEVRPLICRLWGNVEEMKCEHGCKPDRYLTEEESEMLINEMQLISKEITNSGEDSYGPFGSLLGLKKLILDKIS